MRVIAGSARSLLLKTPPGNHTRPTTDKYKETLFNVLQSYIGGAVFVDLFSGSGAIGIEALSRGAKKAYFIENNTAAHKCILDNLNHTKLAEKAVVYKQDVLFALQNSIHEPVDVIFMDPPYLEHAEVTVLQFLSTWKCMQEDTIIVVECNLEAEFDFLGQIGLEIYKTKEYKTCQHVFIRRTNECE